jgi:hypothetical protein
MVDPQYTRCRLSIMPTSILDIPDTQYLVAVVEELYRKHTISSISSTTEDSSNTSHNQNLWGSSKLMIHSS